ncbi:hypothetical protein P0Y67_22275 [Photobacterium sp. SP02]|uniref:hypothetical protein n=1 Tax=Photobacterium sp. SP02 TaxID=3032280 RepID=UPI0031451D04
MKTTVVAIIGDWNGGHHGKFPLLLEYEPAEKERPLYSSEGWGHGFSGNRFTLEDLNKYGLLDIYDQPESRWAFQILQECLKNGDSSHVAGAALLSKLQDNLPDIPDSVKGYLSAKA